jgi:hypothetical protein
MDREVVMARDNEALRVANCSGFYGDRLSAAREMVEGGPIDVLTGDYLAELTMLILLKDKTKDPELGYARTFLRQLQQVARTCRERDVRIVTNAGGMNPTGLADAAQRLYESEGLKGRVAHIEGDDLLPRLDELMASGETLAHLDKGIPLCQLEERVLSANAYLGGWGIRTALERGADLVVCPRVTDASLVVGPAAWRFGWARDDWDQLAGAVVAGHVLECGAQCTGGNYSFFDEIPSLDRPGFPIAEIHADGSFVVTKHEGTGGAVSVGTVTAQLLYEIQSQRYVNPDVVARFDTLRLEQEGPDRVRVSGIRGEPAPPSIKVCLNHLGGYKNSLTLLLPGLDSEAKARIAETAFWEHVGGREQFAETRVTLRHGGDPDSERFALLTIAARDPDEAKVGRPFWNAAIEMALGNYPGFHAVHSSRSALAVSVYWPALVSAEKLDERVIFEGESIPVTAPPRVESFASIASPASPPGPIPGGPTRELPLGTLLGARSGDKGGNANVGFWARSPEAYLWMADFLTAERLRELYPEARGLRIDRFDLPNILALNFVLHGLLGDGVAASLRPDPQAKMLGEELRRMKVPIPEVLLPPRATRPR